MGERKSLVDIGGYQPGRSVIKRGEIRLKPSSIKGLYICRIIAPETGFFNATRTVDLYHIPPGGQTERCRQDEILLHVLTGEGYSIIDDVKYEWEPGDTIHIKPGYWHQHRNTSTEAANMLAAKSTPLLKYLKVFGKAVNQPGAVFTPLGDYVPDPPFGLGKRESVVKTDREWPGGSTEKWVRAQKETSERQLKEGRTIMKGKDLRWEVSPVQGGQLTTMLAARYLGFDTRTITHLGIQSEVSGGCNETHMHGEAIVYIRAGKGYALINGERYDLEEGDCVFVHYGQWHQFCSTSGPNDPLFTQIRILTSAMEEYLFPFQWFEKEEDPAIPDFDPSYTCRLPW